MAKASINCHETAGKNKHRTKERRNVNDRQEGKWEKKNKADDTLISFLYLHSRGNENKTKQIQAQNKGKNNRQRQKRRKR